jgi:hypothetical protein
MLEAVIHSKYDITPYEKANVINNTDILTQSKRSFNQVNQV